MKKLSEMSHDELTQLCRYYHGEKDNPYQKDHTKDGNNKGMLWGFERSWVFDTERNSSMLEEYLGDFMRAGLLEFRQDDIIPMSLKAVLFNRFMKDSMDSNTEPFKAFYNRYY